METQFILVQKTEANGEKWDLFISVFLDTVTVELLKSTFGCQLQKQFVILIGLTKIGFAHIKRCKEHFTQDNEDQCSPEGRMRPTEKEKNGFHGGWLPSLIGL